MLASRLVALSALQAACAAVLALPPVRARADWPAGMSPAPTSHDSAHRALTYCADEQVPASDVWFSVASLALEAAYASQA